MIAKYLKLACEGQGGEKCEYCGTENCREDGRCTQCSASMPVPIFFVFGVPVYDPKDAMEMMKEEMTLMLVRP